MLVYNQIITHTPLDFVSKVEDWITDIINDIEIDITQLPSYYAYKGYDDEIEVEYDEAEAYPLRLAAFKEDLKRKGWYYMLVFGTSKAKKWQRATRNPKLYNRIQRFVNTLIENSF